MECHRNRKGNVEGITRFWCGLAGQMKLNGLWQWDSLGADGKRGRLRGKGAAQRDPAQPDALG